VEEEEIRGDKEDAEDYGGLYLINALF